MFPSLLSTPAGSGTSRGLRAGTCGKGRGCTDVSAVNSDEQYEKAPFLFHRPGFSLGAGRVPRQFALGTDLAKLLPLPTWGPSGFMSLSAQKGVEEHPQRQEVGEEVECGSPSRRHGRKHGAD